ncbi:MAG: diacylglycerol kinase family protein [Pseudomonadota bacterium]
MSTDLAEMAAQGVQIIIIDGGDGTVREVISRAPSIWAAAGWPPPRYAIIAHGNTNLIARSAGKLRPRDIDELICDPRRFRETQLRVMLVDRPGEPPMMGFIMGVGAYEVATRLAQRDIAARHGLQVILAILKLLRSPELHRPNRMGFGIDGGDDMAEDRMLVGISTLPGALLYRLQPFWGNGKGPLRWLDIRARPRRLWFAVPFIAFGRPLRWMRDDYRSGRAHRIRLNLTSPFVMDGEVFDSGTDGTVSISAEETATFLSSR